MTAYLLTDIEGSTRLWETNPGTMGAALARHDELLRAAFAAHGGTVVRTAGDAFTVAFGEVAEAAGAALDAQRALLAEGWPTDGPLRVRMAIDLAEGLDGPAALRFDRLLVRGHGGQILISDEACGESTLPQGEGQGRGHDPTTIPLADRIHALLAPDLPQAFPPLRELHDERPVPTNLPASTTSFVGREAEVAALVGALRAPGLLTLAGPGGTGKTRLALRVARKARRTFPGGVWLVELAPLSDPALVEATFAAAVGATPDELAKRPSSEPALVVLDNCEHLLDASRDLAQALLERFPSLRVLATSRQPLGLDGERVVRVPALSPDESVRLFVERATAQRADFALTDVNRPVAEGLCARLDGIPLAVELAAARVRSLSVEQIAARLDDRFRLLTGGSRAALPRQQTLRALVEWSHDLLNERERTVLRRLAVFVGGWTADDAAAVVGDGDLSSEEVIRRLEGLADRSLLTREAKRYGMLETIRHYALDRLREAGEEPALTGRHAAHFAALADAEGPRSRDHAEAMARLAADTDNLRAALDRGTPALRLGMVGSLRRFWVMRGMAREARARALAALREDDPPTPTVRRVAAIATACALGGWAGDAERLGTLVREGIALAERLGEREMHMTLLNEIASVLKAEGDLRAARAAYEAAARVMPSFPPYGNLAIVLTLQGEYPLAEAAVERAEEVLRAEGGGSPYFRAFILSMRVRLLHAQGRTPEAEAVARTLIALAEELGAASVLQEGWSLLCDCCLAQGRFEEAEAIVRRMAEEAGTDAALEPSGIQLAQVAIARGRYAEAVAPLRASLAAARPLYLPVGLEAAVRRLAATGRPREAAVLLGAANAERRRGPMPLMPVERPDHELLVGRLREAVEDFDAALAEGEGMDREAATAYALSALTIVDNG